MNERFTTTVTPGGARRLLLHAAMLLLACCLAAACAPRPGSDAGAQPPAADRARAGETVSLSAPDQQLLGRLIHEETNLARQRHGLSPLQRLGPLETASREHSRHMVQRSFFGHIDPAGVRPADRVRAQGLRPAYVAENIAQVFARDYRSGERVYIRGEGPATVFSREPGGAQLRLRTYGEVAAQVVADWLASPGHRANILGTAGTHHGAGCELERPEVSVMPMFVCTQLFFAPLPG